MLLCFREAGEGDSEAASALAHRIEEASTLLRGMGVRLVRLEGAEATDLLAGAADPEAEPSRTGIGSASGVVEGSW